MRPAKRGDSVVKELQLIRKEIQREDLAGHPPQLTIVKGGTITMRYNANSAANISIAGKYLLNWLSMAVTTTTSFRICAAIKIVQIKMWSPGNISTTTNVSIGQPGISWEWYNVANQTTDSTKQSDQPSPSHDAFLRIIPPRGSDVAEWISSGGRLDTTDAMASVFVQVGTIVDYTFKFRLVDDDTVFGAEAPVGATAGKVYYDYMDGRASGVLSPLNVNVITMNEDFPVIFQDGRDPDRVASVDQKSLLSDSGSRTISKEEVRECCQRCGI